MLICKTEVHWRQGKRGVETYHFPYNDYNASYRTYVRRHDEVFIVGTATSIEVAMREHAKQVAIYSDEPEKS